MAEPSQDYPFGIRDVVELLQLKTRRRQANSIYVDCPFCGDHRGRLNINFTKNVWRCNRCGESGGMLSLYGKYCQTTNGDAFREICEALNIENRQDGLNREVTAKPAALETAPQAEVPPRRTAEQEIPQSEPATAQQIHQTLSFLFRMLTLRENHREHLRSEKRGLTDEQIDRIGFKSTPQPFLCQSLTERLIRQGCVVQGVPGFYQDYTGQWTVNFNQITAGILIPAVGMDGLLCGAQILLDSPLKDPSSPPDRTGAKYIWFSSSTRRMGRTSGSPVHFAGNPFARTVYILEGLLKADIVHCLTGRSVIAIAGANNTGRLEPILAMMAHNGVKLLVEAHDMDKYSNAAVSKGADTIFKIAMKVGLDCRRLTWNPNYKGMDDWQLALKRNEKRKLEEQRMNFKQKFLEGLCDAEHLSECVAEWHAATENGVSLREYLGLTPEEYSCMMTSSSKLIALLDQQRSHHRYRIYQLDLENQTPVSFAFQGIEAMHKAGFAQPPAAKYCLVWDDEVIVNQGQNGTAVLEHIFARHNEKQPEGYQGRSLSPSDVVELYDDQSRRYYYCDTDGFKEVRFSPLFAKIMQEIAPPQRKMC